MSEKRLYNHKGKEFILEPVSDSVIRVTHREQTGFFGLRGDWEPNEPYTWARHEGMVRRDYIDPSHGLGIETHSVFTYSSSDGALKALCESMLNDQRSSDAKRANPEERKAAARRVMGEMLEGVPVLREESPSGPTLSCSQTADRDCLLYDENAVGDRMVTVRLDDLCTIADSVAILVDDLDNGKYKYVGIDLEPLHKVVGRWGPTPQCWEAAAMTIVAADSVGMPAVTGHWPDLEGLKSKRRYVVRHTEPRRASIGSHPPDVCTT